MAITNKRSKTAVSIYMLLVTIAFCGLLIRLFYLQVIKGEYFTEKAYNQQTDDRMISPERGTIYDATGTKKLAQSTSVNVITVKPTDITKKDEVATKLAEFTGVEKEKILEKISKNVSSVEVADEVEPEKASEILKWISAEGIKGISVDETVKRIYPYNNLAAQVIGTTGADSQGLFGIEYQYDSILAGIEGKITGNFDSFGRETPFKEEEYISPQDGKDLILTLDATIQQITEKELKKSVLENEADNGVAIVMRPKTGEIVSMVSYPDFDLNNSFTPNSPEVKQRWGNMSVGEKNNELNKMWRNTCISNSYEPGSCFKLITTAAALSENVVKLDDPGRFYCKGYVEIGGWKIKCWRHPRTHGSESLREGLQNSCNPVFMQLSQMMSKDTFCRYLENFYIGKKTGIDLPAEATGIVHDPKTITDVDVATTAFGQTISVTPIQLISAVSAIANGGDYIKPHIVKAIKSQDDTYYENIEPQVLKKVISKEASADVLSAMETTVTSGTASGGKISGYRVGGKTATAEQGRGNSLWYAAGFIGVAPVNDPELVVLVYLYNPTGSQGHQGGLLCAPVVGNILSESLSYYDIKPDYSMEENNVEQVIVQDVEEKDLETAKSMITSSRLNVAVQGNGTNVVAQIPKGGASLIPGATVQLFTEENTAKATTRVPDVRGKTMVDAIRTINNAGLNIRVSGSGKAITQDVFPDTELDKGSIITVKFAEGEEWQ